MRTTQELSTNIINRNNSVCLVQNVVCNSDVFKINRFRRSCCSINVSSKVKVINCINSQSTFISNNIENQEWFFLCSCQRCTNILSVQQRRTRCQLHIFEVLKSTWMNVLIDITDDIIKCLLTLNGVGHSLIIIIITHD